MQIYTKESLIEKLKEIRDLGWVECKRPGNDGGIGNTLEDLLGIEENNLPIPNAAEWELKTQRFKSSSLTTLFHLEPSPTALKFVPSMLLPKYGWSHKEAGKKYFAHEMSFRQTIHGMARSDRGFKVNVDHTNRKVLISFDSGSVSERHKAWLKSVETRVGNLAELNPQPYWGFDDLFHKAGTKLKNTFFIQADAKKFKGIRHYHYQKIMMLKDFSIDRFVEALEQAVILVDFDARTGHNHGTKFRLRRDKLHLLYRSVEEF